MEKIKNPEWWRQAPFVTYILLTLNIAVFIWMLFVFGTTQSSEALVRTGANFRPFIVHFNEWWRLLTAGFIHIGIEHILMNMVSLYFVGIELEKILGHGRYLVIYLISVLGGNVVSFGLASAGALSAGASTGIFGLFAAYIVLGRLYPQSSYLRQRGQTFMTLFVINVLMNLFSGTIDNWGHMGGALMGALMTAAIGIKQYHPLTKKQRLLIFISIILLLILFIFIGIQREF